MQVLLLFSLGLIFLLRAAFFGLVGAVFAAFVGLPVRGTAVAVAVAWLLSKMVKLWVFTRATDPGNCLTRKLTVQEAESHPTYRAHATWGEFKDQLRSGDELWEFRSPGWTWERLRGREGLVILRDGKPTHVMHTVLN